MVYMLLGGYPPFYEPDDDQKAMFRNHPWLNKPRSELIVRDLNRNMMVFKNYRTARVLNVGAVSANIAIDVIRHLSGASLTNGYTVNDAAVGILRKISGASLNDIAADAAIKRSASNVFKSSPHSSNKKKI